MAKKRYHPLTVMGTAGLAWNLIGLLALAGEFLAGESARYTMSAAQRALADLTPNWVIIGSIVAVAGGIAGSIGLLLRRNWSIPMFIMSLLGIVGQDVGMGMAIWFAGTLPDPFTLVMQTLIPIIAVALLVMALAARGARELR